MPVIGVHSHKLNLWVGGGFSALVASSSGVGGAFAAAGAAAALGLGGIAAGAAVLGFLAGGSAVGGLATLGWRALYRYALRRGEKTIGNLLGSIAVDIETGGGFSSPRF
ncbi:MAG: hypothetical protein F4151_13840 [Gammaproteobacteria bacterium]|nr:hypothetical protein [Gammaproteobacteria bacterium]